MCVCATLLCRASPLGRRVHVGLLLFTKTYKNKNKNKKKTLTSHDRSESAVVTLHKKVAGAEDLLTAFSKVERAWKASESWLRRTDVPSSKYIECIDSDLNRGARFSQDEHTKKLVFKYCV